MKSIIHDVADVTMLRLSDNKVIFTGEAQLTSLSQKVDTQDIRGGIGSRLIFVSRSGKNITLTVRNAIWDSDYLEIISGLSYNTETNSVFKREKNLLCQLLADDEELLDDTRSLDNTYSIEENDGSNVFLNYLFGTTINNKIIITGVPKSGGIIKVISKEIPILTIPGFAGLEYIVDGTQYDGTYSNGAVSFNDAVIDNYYTCIYEIEVTGKTIHIRTDKFPEKYSVEYRTIEYSLSDNRIVNDIYLVFGSALPSGDFDVSFESGKPVSPELTFTALRRANSNELGKIIEIVRN